MHESRQSSALDDTWHSAGESMIRGSSRGWLAPLLHLANLVKDLTCLSAGRVPNLMALQETAEEGDHAEPLHLWGDTVATIGNDKRRMGKGRQCLGKGEGRTKMEGWIALIAPNMEG